MTSPLDSLPMPLSQALAEKGYESLTSVQEAVLDPRLAGRDMLVSAQTGSGKTVAFGLAIAPQLLGEATLLPPPDAPRALVIAPTRELAMQVRRELEWLYARAGAAIASCVGGMDVRTERRALERGAHIVVATPGRLRDHIERDNIDLGAVQAVVLDEADEMLDLGFREDLEFILQALPAERRTLLFSATVSPGIERLARTYQRDAHRLATANSREAHVDIAYRALTVSPADSENAIVNVLRYYEARNALVFCKTRAAVNHLTARLLNRGFAVVPLSGELAQDERARALQAMRDGRARVCVATDVAARGIDLPGLELVIHADLPSNREALLHRSGRTGRAGNKGVSALIVPLSARRKTERLLSMAGVHAEWAAAPTAAEVSERDTERLMTDAMLVAPETADEGDLVDQLVEKFQPRQLAVALSRMYFAARTPPEDISPVSLDSPKPRARAAFERSFWMRVGVGHDQRAEARWLLPMLCRVGNLTKADIGAIRIFDDSTLVQLHEDCRERFMGAIGAGMELEQGITLSPAEAPAEGTRPPSRPRRDDGNRPERAPRKPVAAHQAASAERPHGDRPARPGKGSAKGPAQGAAKDAARSPRSDPAADGPARKPRAKAPAPRPRRPQDTERPGPAAHPAPDGATARPGKPADSSLDRPAGKPRPRIDPEAARNPSARLGAPKGTKPAKFGARPGKFAGKPAGKPSGKPSGRPGGKSGGKPGGKFATRPKPAGPRGGGDARPTRPKR